jgi:7-carboxy-7-deazaguanine synthase
MILSRLSDEQQKTLDGGLSLPLMEQFYTIQGEGFHTGRPAYFVRIGGCDVGCHWCDVKESWDASIHPLTHVDEIVRSASDQPSGTVVITGGEPLTYNLGPLTDRMRAAGLSVHIETSGAHPLSGKFDWICLSPKKNMPPKDEFYPMADELKVIVHNRHDFEWAEQHAARVKDGCRLYLQPEWSKAQGMTSLIVDYVMQNPKWNVSLQSHKYMGIP